MRRMNLPPGAPGEEMVKEDGACASNLEKPRWAGSESRTNLKHERCNFRTSKVGFYQSMVSSLSLQWGSEKIPETESSNVIKGFVFVPTGNVLKR